MSARRLAEILVRMLAVVVLGASAIYLLVYLFRWEWNRALVAGLFVLAAEIAVIGGAIARRLRSVEALLSQQREHDREQRIRERLAAAPAPRSVSFAWLREPTDGAGVFVPVLLGAGAVLSAVAYVVERVAVATAEPLLQRDVARRLAALRLPESGFLPGPGRPPTPERREATAGRTVARRVATWSIIVLVVALLATAGVVGLAGATQARNEPDRSGQATRITLAVANRAGAVSSRDTFELLWGACRPRVPRGVRIVSTRLVDAGVVEVVLDHGLGRTSARKLGGCLEDVMLDLVRGQVVEMVVLTGEPGVAPHDPRWAPPPS